VRGGVQLGPLGTEATNGLLCQPRVIMMMEKLVECLAGEAEVLWENVPQCRFVHHKSHMLLDANPGRRGGKPASNRLSYGTANPGLSYFRNVIECRYRIFANLEDNSNIEVARLMRTKQRKLLGNVVDQK
jgi:hypothetical protein